MPKKKKYIYRGRYYWHYDRSPKGQHPALVYKKSERRDRYHILCFTSTPGKQRTKLKTNIDPARYSSDGWEDCYVLNKPQVVYSRSLGRNLKGYEVTDKDDKRLLRKIKKKK